MLQSLMFLPLTIVIIEVKIKIIRKPGFPNKIPAASPGR